jgi:hypothetical protein
MRYTTRLIPRAVFVIAATAVGIACTGASDESEGATQAALKADGNNPPSDNGTVKSPPPPKCGDGHCDTDKGEECDLGADNGMDGKECTKNCKKVHRCGDGHCDKDRGEECDLGEDNGRDGMDCTKDCKFPPPHPGGQTW